MLEYESAQLCNATDIPRWSNPVLFGALKGSSIYHVTLEKKGGGGRLYALTFGTIVFRRVVSHKVAYFASSG